uniref:Ig-like domain-containing protein n=1 Tax=Zonotrichia albicollis TaxID=44394 RepID=A0A8D2M3Y8_ZONAL
FPFTILFSLSSWGVSYPESLRASGGSCLVVPCTFSYPADVTTGGGIVAIWYKDYEGQRTVVFHSAAPQDVDSRFGGRAQLLGDPMARNCTLLLRGVTPGDSGLYRFRFEIIHGDRWSASRDVTLSISDDLELPSVTSSEEQTEGQRSTLECSTPYFCPGGDTALHWEGYDPQVSQVSSHVQLDTSGVSHQVTLTSSFTWKDHSKKLLCVVSDGSKRASTEVVLRVRPPVGGWIPALPSSSGTNPVTICGLTSSPPPSIDTQGPPQPFFVLIVWKKSQVKLSRAGNPARNPRSGEEIGYRCGKRRYWRRRERWRGKGQRGGLGEASFLRERPRRAQRRIGACSNPIADFRDIGKKFRGKLFWFVTER